MTDLLQMSVVLPRRLKIVFLSKVIYSHSLNINQLEVSSGYLKN